MPEFQRTQETLRRIIKKRGLEFLAAVPGKLESLGLPSDPKDLVGRSVVFVTIDRPNSKEEYDLLTRLVYCTIEFLWIDEGHSNNFTLFLALKTGDPEAGPTIDYEAKDYRYSSILMIRPSEEEVGFWEDLEGMPGILRLL